MGDRPPTTQASGSDSGSASVEPTIGDVERVPNLSSDRARASTIASFAAKIPMISPSFEAKWSPPWRPPWGRV